MASRYSYDFTLTKALPSQGTRKKEVLIQLRNLASRALSGASLDADTLTQKEGSTRATATVTLSTCVAGTVIEINGVPFTAISGTTNYSANGEFGIGGATDTLDAAALATVINASTDARISGVLTASASSGVVTLTATDAGYEGNAISVKMRGVVAAGTLACGTDAATTNAPDALDTFTINGIEFTFVAADPEQDDNEVLLGATNAETAINVAEAINACDDAIVSDHVRAYVSGASSWVVKLQAKYDGPQGNAITLASSEVTELAVSGARLTGGTEASSGGAQATGTVTITGADGGNYTVLINGVTTGNVAGTNGDDNATAASVAAAIQALTNSLVQDHVKVSVATNVITITSLRGGLSGNAITLSATGTGAVADVARLAGGAAPLTAVPSGARMTGGSTTATRTFYL